MNAKVDDFFGQEHMVRKYRYRETLFVLVWFRIYPHPPPCLPLEGAASERATVQF
jgi:hypothetical protein